MVNASSSRCTCRACPSNHLAKCQRGHEAVVCPTNLIALAKSDASSHFRRLLEYLLCCWHCLNQFNRVRPCFEPRTASLAISENILKSAATSMYSRVASFTALSLGRRLLPTPAPAGADGWIVPAIICD